MTIHIDAAEDEIYECGPFTVSLDRDGDFDITYSDAYGIILLRKQAAELLPILQHYVETGKLPE